MGNYRFRFSDMIPNAWFYKLKDMSGTRKHYPASHSIKKKPPLSTSTSEQPHNSQANCYYYFPSEANSADIVCSSSSPTHSRVSGTYFADPPRNSSRRRAKRRTVYKPSPRAVTSASAACSCNAAVWTNNSSLSHSPDYSVSLSEGSSEPDSIVSDSGGDKFAAGPPPASFSDSYNCKVSSSTTDIIIDVNNETYSKKFDKIDGFSEVCEIELPPILTKAVASYKNNAQVGKFNRSSSRVEEIKSRQSVSVRIVKEESIRTQKEGKLKSHSHVRKSFANSPGIKLRANSPRIASKKVQACGRKSLSAKSRNGRVAESFAVVKSSFDPQRDFRDSMVEMIVENNIRASKDLEDLLACYLSLNSDEYHDLIVKAFEQIWVDMTNLRL